MLLIMTKIQYVNFRGKHFFFQDTKHLNGPPKKDMNAYVPLGPFLIF